MYKGGLCTKRSKWHLSSESVAKRRKKIDCLISRCTESRRMCLIRFRIVMKRSLSQLAAVPPCCLTKWQSVDEAAAAVSVDDMAMMMILSKCTFASARAWRTREFVVLLTKELTSG